MKEVDFRPDSYRVGRSRRRNMVIRVTLLSILAAELVLGSLGSFTQKAAARQEMIEVMDGLESQADVFQEIDGLLSELNGLRQKRELLMDVAGGAPMHRVLAALSHLMPETVVLNGVKVVQKRRIGDTSTVAAEGSKRPASAEKDGVGRLEIAGWAASDVDVGAFMSNMAESALLRNVKLSYSKPVIVKGRAARGFELICEFPQFE